MKERNLSYEEAMNFYKKQVDTVFNRQKKSEPSLQLYDLDFFYVYYLTKFEEDAKKYIINNYKNQFRKKYISIIKSKLDNGDINTISYEDVIDFDRDEGYDFKSNEYKIKTKYKKKYSKKKSKKRRIN